MERKEAIEVVRGFLNPNESDTLSNALKTLIPELENEDEKIRKTLIRLFKEDHGQYYGGLTKEQILTWLEKQGEQKSWSEDDEYQINTILHGLNLKEEIYKKQGNKVEEDRYNTQYNWLKSFKDKCKYAIKYDKKSEQPHWKPGEEQINAFEHFVRSIGESGYASPYDNNTKLIYSLLDDLKKLL